MGDRFAPLRMQETVTENRHRTSNSPTDAIVEVGWNQESFRFAVQACVPFHPKAIQEAATKAAAAARQLKLNPLVVAPYLSEPLLRSLQSQAVSGVDLCGNCVLVVPKRLLVYRTGHPNEFPSSNVIRNVYRGASSLVARAFLLCPEYNTAQELSERIAAQGGSVTLPTVSKVCSALEDDLIIERKRSGRTTRLRLLQADKLLNQLAENHAAPLVTARFVGKCSLEDRELQSMARRWRKENQQSVAQTGACSSHRYATMAREPIRQLYCTDVDSFLRWLGKTVDATDRFPNLELLETDDPLVYFDTQDEIHASPIQAYLELNSGEKRERETAQQIRDRILNDLVRENR